MIGHLIHIGAPKTGSVLLRRWFASHPQLAYLERSIAGYRDVLEIAREGAVPRSGIRYRVTSSESLAVPYRDVGKPVLNYDRSHWTGMPTWQAEVCASLAALFPTAQVLLVTRGFRGLILSAYSQFVRTGGELDFPDFCHQLREATLAGTGAWDYGHLTRVYRAAFGVENLLVVPYELLRDDADGFIRVIEGRLGLDHVALPGQRMNASLSGEEMYWYPRLSRTVKALPGGRFLRPAYVQRALVNRFRRPIALLQRLRPGRPVTLDLIPDELVDAFRGMADPLRDNSLYAPYAADYLF